MSCDIGYAKSYRSEIFRRKSRRLTRYCSELNVSTGEMDCRECGDVSLTSCLCSRERYSDVVSASDDEVSPVPLPALVRAETVPYTCAQPSSRCRGCTYKLAVGNIESIIKDLLPYMHRSFESTCSDVRVL